MSPPSSPPVPGSPPPVPAVHRRPHHLRPAPTRGLALVLTAAALGLIGGGGCRSKATRSDEERASGSSSRAAGFRYLRDFDVLSGTVPVRVVPPPSGAELELAVAGKVVARAPRGTTKLSWDTTRAEDGLVPVTLGVRGEGAPKTLDRATVVVMNRGSEVFFNNGSQGTIEVPLAGYTHQHLRYHWDMPADVREVVGILQWQEPGFKLELALGRGTCPHHGVQVARAEGTRSPVVVEHHASEDAGALPQGQWFAHLRLLNPEAVAGKQAPFTVRAYLFR